MNNSPLLISQTRHNTNCKLVALFIGVLALTLIYYALHTIYQDYVHHVHMRQDLKKYFSNFQCLAAPYNRWIERHTKNKQYLKPIIPLSLFPEHQLLEYHYEEIKKEILDYLFIKNTSSIPSASETSPAFFKAISNSQNPDSWKTVVLKWYTQDYNDIIQYFPKTFHLLQQCGDKVRLAMFSIMAPGNRVPIHRGPFRGCMRYHLGIVVPKEREQCYITIDGDKYSWQEGKSVLFDDTFMHEVYNSTNEWRIVLFLDIQRTDTSLSPVANIINNTVCHSPAIAWLSQINDQNEKNKTS